MCPCSGTCWPHTQEHVCPTSQLRRPPLCVPVFSCPKQPFFAQPWSALLTPPTAPRDPPGLFPILPSKHPWDPFPLVAPARPPPLSLPHLPLGSVITGLPPHSPPWGSTQLWGPARPASPLQPLWGPWQRPRPLPPRPIPELPSLLLPASQTPPQGAPGAPSLKGLSPQLGPGWGLQLPSPLRPALEGGKGELRGKLLQGRVGRYFPGSHSFGEQVGGGYGSHLGDRAGGPSCARRFQIQMAFSGSR